MDTYANHIADRERAGIVTQQHGRLAACFFLFAGLQALIIVASAVIALFVAPASLFVSRTNDEATLWITIGLVAFVFGVLGIVLFLLAIIAGIGLRKNSNWGRFTGFIVSIVALLEFPVGTAFGIYALMRLMKGKPTTI